ncbi:hypothetical protein N5D09_02490 [Stutzerimonas stutzeri]|jgi:hypothetical protein|uniref:Uncharacterized protein n=1 Tax=Stutzerimonas stutzeri TaxID=316 RepID=A0ABD4XW91_STUST|nr:hypothetical protein [Stutzerimonas stutzeri]MDH0686953.1 hypothetical protein [Stutzerimonas stutzeri]
MSGNDNFFDDLPVSTRRDKSDDAETAAPSGMDDFVLPPSAEALNVDELLAGLTPPPVEQVEPQASAAATTPSEPAPQADVLNMDLVELPAESFAQSQPSVPPLEPVRDIDGFGGGLSIADADPLTHGSTADAAMGASAAVAPEQEKADSFFQKHKAKIVLVVLLAVVAGWNYHKKQKAAELEASRAAISQPVAPYEAAIQQMQQGDQNISHLDPNSALPFDMQEPAADVAAPAVDPFGGAEDPFGSTSTPEVAQPAIDPVQQQPEAPQQTAAAPVEAVEPPVTPAAEPVPVVSAPQDLQPVVDELKAKVASLEKERDDWKARALKAEGSGKPTQTAQAQKPAAAPRKEPVRTQQARVVSSRPAAQPAQPKAPVTSKPEVQWLGSFMVGNAWHAHAIIAGSVYELSPGQRIAGLRVDSVTATGVKINGHEFR